MTIATEVMRVVIHLKQPVLLDDPGHLRAHVGADDAGGDLGVVVWGEQVAHVMNERGDHQFIIGAVTLCAGRGLQ